MIQKKGILTIFILVIATSLFAESFVWKIQKGDSSIYLGGTIHLLRSSDYPLPQEFEKAYKLSDTLVFETNIGTLATAEFQQSMLTQMFYLDGSKLQDHLSEKASKALRTYAQKNNFNLDLIQHMKATMVAITLSQQELTKLGATQNGVDSYFYQRSVQDQKQTEYFETIEEQFNIIFSLDQENESGFLLYTLESLDEMKRVYTSFIKLWKKGKERQLTKLFIDDLKNQTPKLYSNLLVKRNQAWFPRIQNYFQTKEIEFVLVGAAHLLGEDGLLQMLRDNGYKVTKL